MNLFKTAANTLLATRPLDNGSRSDDPGPAAVVPIRRHTADYVASAYRGKTHLRTFPEALAVAGALESEGLPPFLDLIEHCSAHERGLVVRHLYRNYLHSPRLVEWVKAAGDDFFYAKARVANSGIKKIRRANQAMAQARKIDRDTAGFNVRQESRDALSIVNGLVQARWTYNIGVGGRRSIICLAASLAKLLAGESGQHGLGTCYREYTDLYGIRYSVVARDNGLVDLVLVHPEATELTCEYIESGEFDCVDGLRAAVLQSSVVLKHQHLDLSP